MEKVRGVNPLVKFRTVYVGTSQPPSSETYPGLLWIDTSDSNKPVLKYWNGSEWEALTTFDEFSFSMLDVFSTLSLITQNLREDLEDLKNFRLTIKSGLNKLAEHEEKLQQVQQDLNYNSLSVLDVFSTLSLLLQNLRESLEDLRNFKFTAQEGLKRITSLEQRLEENFQHMQHNILALAAFMYNITNMMLENFDILHRRYAR